MKSSSWLKLATAALDTVQGRTVPNEELGAFIRYAADLEEKEPEQTDEAVAARLLHWAHLWESGRQAREHTALMKKIAPLVEQAFAVSHALRCSECGHLSLAVPGTPLDMAKVLYERGWRPSESGVICPSPHDEDE